MMQAETKALPIAAAFAAADDTVREAPFLRVRLGAQVFLAFAVMGAWLPIFTLYLTKQLGFTPDAVAWASSTNAIGALFAPLIWGQIADRWLAMERSLSVCALVTGVGLLGLTRLSEPWAVFAVCVGIWFFLVPLIGLTSSFVFRQLEHPERDFGHIRVWGTIGWMSANWLLTWWFAQLPGAAGSDDAAGAAPDLADSLRLGGLVAFVVAGYALTLPHTPPGRSLAADTQSWLRRLVDAPWSAMQLFRNPSFVVYCICIFGFYVTMPFTIQLNPLLLRGLGYSETQLPLVLTIAQSTETVSLFLLPLLLTRFGLKPVMLLGCTAWSLGLGVLGASSQGWLVLMALASHGLFISCFVISGQVFVNKQATHAIRASVQGLLVLFTGCGLFLGHLLVGWVRDIGQNSFPLAYLIAAVLAGSLALFFGLGFSPQVEASVSAKETLVPNGEIT